MATRVGKYRITKREEAFSILDGGTIAGALDVSGNISGSSSTTLTVGGKATFNNTVVGHLTPVIEPGAGITFPASASGTTYILNGNLAHKLPTPAVGLHYKFITDSAIGSGNTTIDSTSDGTTAVNLFSGIVETNGAPTSTVDKDRISFVQGTQTEGDYCDVWCISATVTANNPTWHYYCKGDANGAITVA